MELPIPQNHHLSGKKIVIAGAGMAGLSFAIAMYKQWPFKAPPPTMICYERETKHDAISREGYSLSLRSDPPGGIQALRRLGILDTMVEASIKDVNEKDGGFCVWDKSWNEILKLRARVPPSLPVGSLRIARKNLRSVMVKVAVASGLEIHWGIACVSVSKARGDGSSGLVVDLSSDSKESCDMLIAADGASSKLRAQLRLSDTLQFQNIICMGGTAVYPTGESPPSPIDRNWGLMPLNEKRSAVFFSPVGPNTALWSLSYRSDVPVKVQRPPVSDEVATTVLKKVHDHSTNFPSLFHELVNRTDKDSIMVFNARDKAAFAHTTSTIGDFAPHVVFLGDANHAVSPFAGNGANMALCDGWDLAEQLLKSASVKEAVNKYDDIVVPRANNVVRQSHIAIAIAHSQGWRLYLAMLFLRFVKLILFRHFVR